MNREIHVHAGWEGTGDARLGVLRCATVRGSEVFSFSYDAAWLAQHPAMHLDPRLRHFQGSQYAESARRNTFGLFMDSAPDRWGRTLMRRCEAIVARRDGRRERTLQESDFLLGVHDMQRMGGLRLRLDESSPFQSSEPLLAAPPWTSLRALEAASWQVQNTEAAPDARAARWLEMLMAPGSSLGGARPKAGVLDERGALWIAKFPGRSDDCDCAAWEMVVHRLAKAAGLRVPEARLEKFARRHHTFLTRRFDRVPVRRQLHRRHFASAMTMLDRTDGEGAGYLEIAELLQRQGSAVAEDLEELWRRIVFSILVSNTDDHLRNHGFLLTPRGWKLSPAYDLNPNPHGAGLSLNISETDNALDLDVARAVARHFRVKERRAEEIIAKAARAVARWRTLAEELGLPAGERERMAAAFRTM